MTAHVQYLAVYTGPCGPISTLVPADESDRWHAALDDAYESGEDYLDADPDAEDVDALVAAELATGGWLLVQGAPEDCALYVRKVAS